MVLGGFAGNDCAGEIFHQSYLLCVFLFHSIRSPTVQQYVYVLTGHEVGDIWEFDVATETWQCHIVSKFIKYVSAMIARNPQQKPTS